MAFPSALTDRLLDPLTKPWAIVGGGVVGGGAFAFDTISGGLRLAWRLLDLLLSL